MSDINGDVLQDASQTNHTIPGDEGRSVSYEDVPINVSSMIITKASLDPTSGEMRWSATASNTEVDLFGQQMSMSLFKDFVRRIEAGEKVPLVLQSDFWQGGLPYLSVSHYPDFGGRAIVGMSKAVFVDGNRLKAKGTFENPNDPELALRAFTSIKQDLSDNKPADERVRISIGFIDWKHIHGDSYIFVRKSLTDKCPLCTERNVKGVTYLEGQLIHLALTRVPVNEGTDIMPIEERSMPTTRVEDAASIVGEDKAKELEALAEPVTVDRSEAIVVRSEDSESPVIVEQSMDDEGTYPVVVEGPYGGALTITDAQKWLDAAQKTQKVWDMWWLFQDVMYNILDASLDAVPDKAAAVKTAIEDFKDSITAKALVALSRTGIPEVPEVVTKSSEGELTMPHALDPQIEVLRAKFDEVATAPMSREAKLKALQGPLNELASTMQRSISGTTPIESADIEDAVANAVAKQLEPIQAALAALSAQNMAAPVTNSRAVQPRQVRPQFPAPDPALTPAPTGKVTIKDIIQRTVLDYAPKVGG